MKNFLVICFLSLIVFIGEGCLLAQTKKINEQKSKIKKIEQEINFLDNQITATAQKQKNSLEELLFIQKKISNRKNLLKELDIQITEQSNEINKCQNELEKLGVQLDTLEYHYKKMVYNAYKNRDTKVWFMYIIASDNIEQGYRRWSYLKNYSKSINNQSKKIRKASSLIKEKKEQLVLLKESNLKVQKEREKEFKTLTKEENDSKKYVQVLNDKQQEYKKQLNQKRKEAQKLAKEVERLIAAEIKKAQTEEAKKKTKDNKSTPLSSMPVEYKKLSGSFAANKGKLPWPVNKGIIIEKFGEHPHPTLKNIMLPFNNGINISTSPEASVKVIFDGVVKQIIAVPGYNQCVLIQHGNYFTFYCKLSKVDVKVGDNIKAGTNVGVLVENNNTSVLHFELWDGTKKQNPEIWLKNK